MAGWHVTANDIKNWTETNKRRSEEILPLLVKKLILAACKPKEIDFPSGDSVTVGGWDGVLDVDEGNLFIPFGKSGWEFGTNSNVKKKADEDYSKRVKDPKPFDPTETTFVFVTSRLWTKRDSWVESKQSAKDWKQVQGINAETLANWLEICPAVHRWFSQLLGKRCATVWDIEQAWQAYTTKTKVQLNVDFLLHGREEELTSVSNAISGSADTYRVKSASVAEAYGFILAAILNDESAISKCLIIRSQESWDLMASSEQPLILIPYRFSPDEMGTAVANGHTVLLAIDRKEGTQQEPIILNRQPRLIREEGIKKLGFDEYQTRELYQDTKGYLEPLLRHPLLQPIDNIVPKWLDSCEPEALFAALFASEWNEQNEHDLKLLETLSGLSYSEFQKIIIHLSKENDPPIRQVGSIWQIISKVDFWLLIAPRLAKSYLQRLGEVVPVILTDLDPSYDLSTEQRCMASFYNAVPKYSPFLKKEIADTLTLLSVYGDDVSEQLGGEKPSRLVSLWIYRIFEENNSGRFWFSLSGCMRKLAEAAPEKFLAAVEEASEGDPPVILDLFESGESVHSELLSALKLISWNKQYLTRVSTCLARLSEIEIGSNRGNNYLNSFIGIHSLGSLTDIYLGWINNTVANHKERLQILERILIPQHPEIAWRLMVALLPGKTSSSSGICKPEYRDWSVGIEKGVRNIERFYYEQALAELMLQEFDKNIEDRVEDLIENLNSLNKKQQNIFIDRMLAINAREINEESRKKILNKIRGTVAGHRKLPAPKWGWDDFLLDSLEDIYKHFDLDDSLNRNLFLFDDHWPTLINPVKKFSYEEHKEILLRKRTSAIDEIYSLFGPQGIKKLVLQCTCPYIVGSVVFRSSLSEKMQSFAIDWLDTNDNGAEFSKSFFSALANENYERAEKIINENSDWPVSKKARYLLCLPLKSETLKLVDGMTDEGKRLFWSNLNDYFIPDKDIHLMMNITAMLLENDRPADAIKSMIQAFHQQNYADEMDSGLIAEILLQILTKSSDMNKILFPDIRYAILKAIKFLQNADDISEQAICRIEWFYFEAFSYSGFIPRYLIKKIIEDPSFFVQLVCCISERDDGKDDSVEGMAKDVIQQQAEIAWNLLDMVSVLPGQEGSDVCEKTLNEWVDLTRDALKSASRIDIGDDRLGVYLSKCPVGKDGVWPHESVRSVIERIKSKCIDDAINAGRMNSRGMTSRHPYAGGKQERVLAKKYDADAESIQLIFPGTADILRSIASRYESFADAIDRRVELGD